MHRFLGSLAACLSVLFSFSCQSAGQSIPDKEPVFAPPIFDETKTYLPETLERPQMEIDQGTPFTWESTKRLAEEWVTKKHGQHFLEGQLIRTIPNLPFMFEFVFHTGWVQERVLLFEHKVITETGLDPMVRYMRRSGVLERQQMKLETLWVLLGFFDAWPPEESPLKGTLKTTNDEGARWDWNPLSEVNPFPPAVTIRDGVFQAEITIQTMPRPVTPESQTPGPSAGVDLYSQEGISYGATKDGRTHGATVYKWTLIIEEEGTPEWAKKEVGF